MAALFLNNLADLGASFVSLWLAVALLYTVERLAARFVAKRLGWHGVLLTGWLGVPVHELSHLVVAKFFGHRIVSWQLFEPDPATGTLGYVRHAYQRRNVWQLAGNFFVGIAPLLAGSLALLLLAHWMTAAAPAWQLSRSLLTAGVATSPRTVVEALPHALTQAMATLVAALWRERTGWLPLQVYLGIAIASHLAPSPRDLRETLPALPVVIGSTVLVALVGSTLGHVCTSVAVVTPVAGLLVVAVALFQGLYVAAIALACLLRSH